MSLDDIIKKTKKANNRNKLKKKAQAMPKAQKTKPTKVESAKPKKTGPKKIVRTIVNEKASVNGRKIISKGKQRGFAIKIQNEKALIPKTNSRKKPVGKSQALTSRSRSSGGHKMKSDSLLKNANSKKTSKPKIRML